MDDKNTFVVFCGDLLDRKRDLSIIDSDGKTPGEIEGEEDLILGFLNMLSIEALKTGSQIIKLIGNHEGMNVVEALSKGPYDSYDTDNYNNYASEYSKGYYHKKYGKNRRTHFLPGGEGSKDILACSGYPVIKLGDFIFVHGGILPGIVKYMVKEGEVDINPRETFFQRADIHARNSLGDRELQEKGRTGINPVADNLLFTPGSNTGMGGTDSERHWSEEHNSILWERRLGEERIDPVKQCRYLRETFGELGYDVPGNSKTRLVIAHCPTLYRGQPDTEVKSGYIYNEVESNDRHRYVLTSPTKYNFPCPGYVAVPTGITTDCFCGEDRQERLFRIDVAASRAFDQNMEPYYKAHLHLLRYILQARRPQALQITCSGKGEYQTRVLVANRGLTRKWLTRDQDTHPGWGQDATGRRVVLKDVGPIDFTHAVDCQSKDERRGGSEMSENSGMSGMSD